VKGKTMSDSFEKPKDPTQQVITFGKHQGLTVAELLHNHKGYVEWLTGQSWLAERFSDLHAALLSRGAPTDETPEHNKIQARFLEPLFCEALLKLILPGLKSWKKFLEEHWEEHAGRRLCYPKPKENESPTLQSKVLFEKKGIDVFIDYWLDLTGLFEEKHELCNRIKEGSLGIEIKPSLGDDFPTVLRQMERLGVRTCLAEHYTGRGASEPIVKKMFEANGYDLIFVREVEAEMLNLRAPPGD
jgi:hypothetical protein